MADRPTLATVNTAGTAAVAGSSIPVPPTDTTWIGGASGDFETASKWSPTFVQIGGIDYYGDATIVAGSTVTFQGTANADLTSLTLAAGSVLNLTKNALTITTNLVNFGNHHVGDTLIQALTVTNTGTADGFTEALDASLGGASSGVTAKGAFTGLETHRLSNAGTLTIGLATTAEGKHSGTATLNLTSDGTGIDTLGTKTLTAQTITAAATLYALAASVLSTTTLDFGAYRLGSTVPTRALTIANGTTADPFQENLSCGFHSPSNGFALTSAAAGVATSGRTHATASWSVAASVSGVLTTSTDLLDFTSTGVGTSGLADTALPSAQIALRAKVYAPAVAQLSVSAINFGQQQRHDHQHCGWIADRCADRRSGGGDRRRVQRIRHAGQRIDIRRQHTTQLRPEHRHIRCVQRFGHPGLEDPRRRPGRRGGDRRSDYPDRNSIGERSMCCRARRSSASAPRAASATSSSTATPFAPPTSQRWHRLVRRLLPAHATGIRPDRYYFAV